MRFKTFIKKRKTECTLKDHCNNSTIVIPTRGIKLTKDLARYTKVAGGIIY